MARNDVGKWVARAGATGGGRTYRGRAPSNWYAIVAVIVVLGILSVVYSNHEYRESNASSATSTTAPKTGTTWSAGLAIDLCGTSETPPLPSNQTTTGKKKQSFYTTGNGVIAINPQKATDAGKEATFGKFVSAYKGLVITGTKFTYPEGKGKKSITYHNGEVCPKSTPDHGKAGDVMARYWTSALATKTKGTVISGSAAGVRFKQNMEISVGFVPSGTKLPKPGGKVVEALLTALNGTTVATPSTTIPVQSTVTPPTAPTTASTTPSVTTPTAVVTTPTAAAKHPSKSSHKKA